MLYSCSCIYCQVPSLFISAFWNKNRHRHSSSSSQADERYVAIELLVRSIGTESNSIPSLKRSLFWVSDSFNFSFASSTSTETNPWCVSYIKLLVLFRILENLGVMSADYITLGVLSASSDRKTLPWRTIPIRIYPPQKVRQTGPKPPPLTSRDSDPSTLSHPIRA